MFSKFAVIVVAALAVFAAARPTDHDDDGHHHDHHHDHDDGGNNGSCNSGDMYCCNDTYDAESPQYKVFKEYLKFDLPVNSKIGMTCSPVAGFIGKGDGSSCSQQPVCCSGNNYQGVVVVGCSPIIINA